MPQGIERHALKSPWISLEAASRFTEQNYELNCGHMYCVLASGFWQGGFSKYVITRNSSRLVETQACSQGDITNEELETIIMLESTVVFFKSWSSLQRFMYSRRFLSMPFNASWSPRTKEMANMIWMCPSKQLHPLETIV